MFEKQRVELVSVSYNQKNVSPSCRDIIVSLLWKMIIYFQLLSIHALTFWGIKTEGGGGGGTDPPVPPHATALLLIHIVLTLLLLE